MRARRTYQPNDHRGWRGQRSLTARLRRSRSFSLLSLLAMLAQAIFAIDHASAMAVAAARGGPDGTPLGIFEICTAQGLLEIRAPLGDDSFPSPASNSPVHNGAGKLCVLCGSASVTGASSVPLDGPAILVTWRLFQVGQHVAADWRIPSSGPRRSGTTRGPPATLS